MADAQTPPTGGSCPTCGAPVERGQLVCLRCGGRVGLQYKRPPRWQVPVALAAAVVVLAVVGVFLALQAASDEAESEVARGPASREEARGTTQATTQARTRPEETEPEKEPTDSSLAVAKRGPVAVLSGVPENGAAAEYARALKRDGYDVGEVTNAPGGAGSFSVQYADGSEKAAKALADEEGIGEVKAMEPAVADRAGDAKLVVIVGAKK